MKEDMAEFLDLFLNEARDLLQKTNDSLIRLEKKPSDSRAINEIFRYSHTIKSSSASMGFNKISELSNEMENVFEQLRDKKLKATGEVMEILFKSTDALESLVELVAEKKEETLDIQPLIKLLRTVASLKPGEVQDLDIEKIKEKQEPFEKIKMIKVHIGKLDNIMNLVGELVLNKLRIQNLKIKYDLVFLF